MHILICTDGSASSLQSAYVITSLKFSQETKFTCLGVIENRDQLEKINESIDLISRIIGTGQQINKQIRTGVPDEQIMSEVISGHYDLVAVGSSGRQVELLHPKLGTTSSSLARKLHTHFLVTRVAAATISKILVCTGPDVSASKTVKVAGEFIANTSAEIGLLHVVAPGMEPTASSTQGDKLELERVPFERHPNQVIKDAGQQLREAGVKQDIFGRVRQGLVVEQVIREVNEGGYELLVVGAHYQPGQDRWQGTLLDDITDQLLNRCACTVLII